MTKATCPIEDPSEPAALKTTSVPLTRPEKFALTMQGKLVEFRAPERPVSVAPVFAPWATFPAMSYWVPFTLETNVPWRLALTGGTLVALQEPTCEAPQPEARME